MSIGSPDKFGRGVEAVSRGGGGGDTGVADIGMCEWMTKIRILSPMYVLGLRVLLGILQKCNLDHSRIQRSNICENNVI